jgi:hypothetical protein
MRELKSFNIALDGETNFAVLDFVRGDLELVLAAQRK